MTPAASMRGFATAHRAGGQKAPRPTPDHGCPGVDGVRGASRRARDGRKTSCHLNATPSVAGVQPGYWVAPVATAVMAVRDGMKKYSPTEHSPLIWQTSLTAILCATTLDVEVGFPTCPPRAWLSVSHRTARV